MANTTKDEPRARTQPRSKEDPSSKEVEKCRSRSSIPQHEPYPQAIRRSRMT